jgi:uncharacterized membrane protein SpoIIM required for sporulation
MAAFAMNHFFLPLVSQNTEDTYQMKEITFINQNIDRWKKLDKQLEVDTSENPEELAKLFIQLTDDLSYAKTYFPQADITDYLNRLTLKVHQKIYRNKKESSKRFKNFWINELPQTMYRTQKQLLYAFLIFVGAACIGWVSQVNDGTFSRLIMGDSYVNMTLNNIEKGDPMAVYKSMNPDSMFLRITINNIYVAFLAFVFGLFTAVGTGIMLFRNGIMLGSFQAFFYQHDLFWESARTIWVHGSLEISAIIIAGAAGMALGNSFVFPGTYSRLHQFKLGVKNGVKIAFGLVPVFITAGFLEGFVTRHTEMPLIPNLLIILLSFAFIGWYFIWYPIKINHKNLFSHAKSKN